MYNDKAKARTMKYMKEKRENLNINLPLGSKERYKRHAESKGKSLTSLIVDLVEDDILNSGTPAPNESGKEMKKQSERTPPILPKAVRSAGTMSDDEFTERVNALREMHKADGAEREENGNE